MQVAARGGLGHTMACHGWCSAFAIEVRGRTNVEEMAPKNLSL